MNRTKRRLLDIAERMFAKRGYEATSLRILTEEAGVNLASVHYHFGSKAGLIQEVFRRRLRPLNKERLRLLRQAEQERDPPSVEAVLHAFLKPSFDTWRKHPHFVRLAGRIFSEPDPQLKRFFTSNFRTVAVRFQGALSKALPGLPLEGLLWRMHFVIGAMAHTWTSHEALEQLSEGRCNLAKPQEVLDHLVAFCTAGVQAPLPSGEKLR